jgi:peroxiredoxin
MANRRDGVAPTRGTRTTSDYTMALFSSPNLRQDANMVATRGERGRPLLPPTVSAGLTLLATASLLFLVWTVVDQNRMLREALANPNAASVLQAGDTIPAAQLMDLNGNRKDLRQVVDSGGVLAFFTTTCPYCEQTLPVWRELARDLREQNVPFVGVSLHEEMLPRNFLTANEIDWPILLPVDADARSALKARIVPLTALFGADGSVVRTWRGALSTADAEAILQAVNEMRRTE